MKHLFSVLVLVALASPALADDSAVALDYRADDASCIDASRFADEVSAKLGFVPWHASAPAKIKVRVEKDGNQFTGSVRNVDGTAKMIDGPTCAAVTSKLAVTVAGAMDSTSAVEQPASTLAPAPTPAVDDGKLAVTFASTDGRRVDITQNTATGFSSGGAMAAFYESVCTTPCTARLATGRHFLVFHDPSSQASVGTSFLLDKPTTLTLREKSNSRRRWTMFGVGVALAGAGIIGGIKLDGASEILSWSVVMPLGLGLMAAPIYVKDTFTITQAP